MSSMSEFKNVHILNIIIIRSLPNTQQSTILFLLDIDQFDEAIVR